MFRLLKGVPTVLVLIIIAGTSVTSGEALFKDRGDRSSVSAATAAILDHVLTAPDFAQREQIDGAFKKLRSRLLDIANSGLDPSEMTFGSEKYVAVHNLTDEFMKRLLDRVWTRFGGALDSVLPEEERERFARKIRNGTYRHDEFRSFVRSRSGKDMGIQFVKELERSLNHMMLQDFVEPLRKIGWSPVNGPGKSG